MKRCLFIFSAIAAVAANLFSLSCQKDQTLFQEGKCNPATTNVLLIVIDTLRADHLSLYGYERRTCPNLEKLAEGATLFTNAVCSSTWTVPAHASLFTGKYPFEHGAHNLKSDNYEVGTLKKEHVTLAEIFRKEHFSTCAIIGNAAYLAEAFGLHQGFEEYRCDHFRRAPAIAGEAIAWMEKHPHFFLFLNFLEPHHPNRPSPPYDTAFPGKLEGFSREDHKGERLTQAQHAHVLSQYDGEILLTDFHMGKIFDAMKKSKSWDDTLIVVTSDHGELLGERNRYGHRKPPYEPLLRIPLLIKFPGQRESRRVDGYFQLVDIMPMILRLLDLPLPEEVKGRGKPGPAERVFSQYYLSEGGTVFSVRDGTYKLLVKAVESGRTYELYNLERDPEETVNLARQLPEKVRAMEKQIRDVVGEGPASESETAAIVDQGLRKKLIELGYIREDNSRQAEKRSFAQHTPLKQKRP